MPKTYLHNATRFFLNGSGPSLFKEVSDESAINYLLIDECLVPSHGKINPSQLPGPIRKIYQSQKDATVYLVCGASFCRMNSDGSIETLFVMTKTQGDIQIAENENSEIGITTGNSYWVYNYSTQASTLVGAEYGFTLANPNSIVCIDTIFFISDAFTSRFTASQPNNALLWTPAQVFAFDSKPDNIMTLAFVDRVLFVIGRVGVERWVVIGGEQLLNRDNVFLLAYGLYDKQSLADKFNMFVGIFAAREGQPKVQLFQGNGQGYQELSTPGIVKKMLASGPLINSDLYEIDSHIYYEAYFQNGSFIYNFKNKSWTQATNGFEQVVFVNGSTYAASGSNIYTVTPYDNDQLKTRRSPPAFPDQKFGRFTIGKCSCWYSNAKAEAGEVLIFSNRDGVTDDVIDRVNVDGQEYYSLVSREFNTDCFQFSLIVQTYLNIKWRAFSAEVVSYG